MKTKATTLLTAAALSIALTACSPGQAPLDLCVPQQAAEAYYSALLSGDAETFLSGLYGSDTLHSGYRLQLLDGYRHFAERQQRRHGGLADIRAVECQAPLPTERQDSLVVLLSLTFNDSTKESIAVPLVNSNGRWLMR